ncbi:MAG TPA: thioredoxin family protein [Candidatus Nitrosopolaris sp.]|nr:thioredoxin family protein [Candidatus Nitrosopolaris sp.]
MNRDNVSAVAMAIAVIAIIVGFGIYFNSPSLNKVSSSSEQQLEKVVSAATTTNGAIKTIKLDKAQFLQIDKSQFQKAPEFAQIAGYVNTPSNAPLTLGSLKGKVVLVDFWTYSCINCIRTLPHLNDWYQKYADKGFVIVGVHSPEFDFEKNYDNVKIAVQKLGIKFPVILDSNHGTWNAYGNMYWPRDYLVDTQGYIRYDHIGEGDYNATESVIQSLLAEKAALNGMKDISFNTSKSTTINSGSLVYIDLTKQITPEIYLGYSFARAPLGNPQNFKPDQTILYSIPPNTSFNPDRVYLDGQWKNNPDNMELQGNTGHIILTYNARAVNIVAGGHGQQGIVHEDGPTKILNNSLGKDLTPDGKFVLDGQRLYNLVLHNNYGSHSIIIDVSGKGFQLYTFTFG